MNNNATLTVPTATGVLANDSDVDNNPWSVGPTAGGVAGTTQHGTLTFNSDGSFTYIPLPFFSGTEDVQRPRCFRRRVLQYVATVTITVNHVTWCRPPTRTTTPRRSARH